MPTDTVFVQELANDLSPDDVARVLAIFREDMQRLTTVLRDAATTGDETMFRRTAHSIAGAAAAVGAMALESASRLAMARDGIRPEMVSLAADIGSRADAAVLQFARSVDALLAGGPDV